MSIKVLCFTHKTLRAKELSRTRGEFKAQGFGVLTVDNPHNDGDPSGLKNRLNAVNTLAAHQDSDVLLIEDDVTPNELLGPMLQLAQKASKPTIMCLLNNASLTPRMRDDMQRGSAECRLEPMSRAAGEGWYGSQAVFLPQWHVSAMLDDESFWTTKNSKPIDITLNKFWIANSIIPLVAVPNPVQHRSPHTLTTTRPPRLSLLFDVVPLPSEDIPNPPKTTRTVDMNSPRPLVRFLTRHRYKGVMNGFGAVRKVDFNDLEQLEAQGVVRRL